MSGKPLVLSENLLNALNDDERKSDVIKDKKITALKPLDQSQLKHGEPLKTVKQIAELSNLPEKTINQLINSIEADDGTLEDLLSYKKYDGQCRTIKYDAVLNEKITLIASGKAIDETPHWSLNFIADKFVKVDIYNSITINTIKIGELCNKIKPYKSEYWKIPSKANSSFVAAMEQLIDLYRRPYNSKEPVICLDESSRQIFADPKQLNTPIAINGDRQNEDYICCDIARIYLAVEPLSGKTFISIGSNRTNVDFANLINCIANAYPNAEKIYIVLDNLNTHTVVSLYCAFDYMFAKNIAKRFCFHYTPKHGSWLNMAEPAIRHFKTLGLSGRIASIDAMSELTSAYLFALSNGAVKPYQWSLSLEEARIKLKSLYPDFVIKDEEFYKHFMDPNFEKTHFLDSNNFACSKDVQIEELTMSCLDGELSIRINLVL